MAPPMVANPVQSNPPSQSTDLPPIPKGSRCEITPQVRSIAHRTQTRMFKRTRLFFNEATFQVPNTVEEAFENMRLGTTDLDRNTSESTEGITYLYLMSWSNTQFFSAQMAALGFRFISCNLRRNAGLENPPPVEQWLRLERFSTPLPSRVTSARPPNAIPVQSSVPPTPKPATSRAKPTLPANQQNHSFEQTPAQSSPNASADMSYKPSQQSPVAPAAQNQKRPAPSDPSSDQDPTSPARKLLRGLNGMRLPSTTSTAANPQNTSSTQEPPNKTSNGTVPVIDLT